MTEAERIGKNIKELITRKSTNAAQVAKEMGVDRGVLYNYIRGRSVPGGLMLKELVEVLDCEYEDILGPTE